MTDNINTPYMTTGPSTFSNQNTSYSTEGRLGVAGLTLYGAHSQSVVALTVSGNSSALTTFTVQEAETGDMVLIGAPSALSADLTYQAHISAASTVQLRLSNVSAIAAAQTAQTWNVAIVKP